MQEVGGVFQSRVTVNHLLRQIQSKSLALRHLTKTNYTTYVINTCQSADILDRTAVLQLHAKPFDFDQSSNNYAKARVKKHHYKKVVRIIRSASVMNIMEQEKRSQNLVHDR